MLLKTIYTLYHTSRRMGVMQHKLMPSTCILILGLTCFCLNTISSAQTYYVDAINGNDSYAGTSAAPWKTIAKSLTIAVSGDTVLLHSGNYGVFTDATERTNWLTFRADTGAIPVFQRVYLGSDNWNKNIYLRFDGITVQSDSSIAENYIFNIFYANYVELLNSTVRGHGYWVCNEMRLFGNHFKVNNCDISNTKRGITCSQLHIAAAEREGEISNNYIHDFSGSGIYAADPVNILIESNHVYRQWPFPDTTSEPIHGSGIGLRTPTAIIRGNIVHSCGNSGSFNIYGSYGGFDGVAYDIIVENNLFYDGGGVNFNGIKSGCRFNNNTVIGHAAEDGDELTETNAYRYHYGQVNLRFDTNYENDFEFFNNIVLGVVSNNQGKTINAGGNIAWVYEYPAPYSWTTNMNNSTITYTNYNVLEVGLFIQNPIDFAWPNNQLEQRYCNQLFQDFQLQSGSIAINAGIPDKGPSMGLGSIDANGFIQNDGELRDTDHHSAGCYEYGSSPSANLAPTANAGPDQGVFDNDNNGIERVTLNGSGSYDSDGNIVSYRWTENGSQIATGVAPVVSLILGVHIITLTVTDDDGATGSDIVAIVINSPPASDTTAPSIISAAASQSSVEVLFSEPVERASAENIANYSINNGVSIISISLNTDLNRTTLLTTEHTDRTTYTLTISNVRDLAGNAMTATTINYSYNEGLVGYWAFDDGAGISAADSSGNSNTGVLVNGPLWHQLCPGQNALNFDGTDDYVNCGNGSTLNLTGSLTISAWINPEDFGQSGWGRIVDKGDSSTGYSLFLDNDTRSIAYVIYGGNVVKANPDTITLDTWQHVAAVYDNLSGTVSFYVDGFQTGSSQYTTPPASSSNFNLTIGNRGYDLSRAFHGLLDDVRVCNRALPADEILNLSTALLPIGDKEVKEGSTLTFEVVSRVPDMVVDINGHNLPSEPSFSSNIFSWRPSIGQAGRYEITFEAQHGDIVDFETITVTVTLTVSLTEGLAGYWQMNDNAADTAVADSGPNGANGTAQRYTSALSTTGTLNNALTFNGISDYVSLSDFNAPDSAAEPLTIAMWVKPANFTATAYQMLFDKLDCTAPIKGFSFGAWQTTGTISFSMRSDNWMQVHGSSALSNNTWSFVAVTYDGSKNANGVTLYVNGKAETKIVFCDSLTADDISNPISAQLGAREGANYPFAGAMDNVMIYNRALSQEEIGSLYNTGEGIELVVNHAPVLSPIGDKSVYENCSISFSVAASDADGDTLTYTAQNLPAGAVFSGNTFTWTPTSGQTGTHQVTFIVSDDTRSDSETITITVTSNASLTDGLVGYWKMNDYASNVTVADSSILDIDGKARKYTSALSTTGKLNGALTFNGTTDYISLADINAFDSAATPMTIAMWVKPTNFTGTQYQMLFDKLDETSPMKGFSFGAWGTTGIISFSMRSDNWLQVAGATVLTNNVWSFVTVTYDGSKRANGVTLYVNGKAETKIVFCDSLTADDISNPISAQLGAREGANYPFAGAMDNVMIYNRALSQEEIGSLYNTGLGKEIMVSPLASGLLGYWKMNDNAATTAVADSSPVDIDGRAQRNTYLLTTTGKLNGALNFNGTTDYISVGDINAFDSAATPMTIAMWVKPTNFTGTQYQMLFDKLDETSPMKGFSFGAWGTTGIISFSMRSDNWLQVAGATVLTNNVWSFVTVTYDGSKRANGVTLYVNGKAESKIVFYDSLTADDISNPISAQLGAREGNHYPFAGAMDNVMIYNRALTQQEITTLYNGGSGTDIE